MSVLPVERMTKVTAEHLDGIRAHPLSNSKHLLVDTINTGPKTLHPSPKTLPGAIARALEEPILVDWRAIQTEPSGPLDAGTTKQAWIKDVLWNEFHANHLIDEQHQVIKGPKVTHRANGLSDLSDLPEKYQEVGEEGASGIASHGMGLPLGKSTIEALEEFAYEVGLLGEVYVKLIDHCDRDHISSMVDLVILDLDITCNLKLQYLVAVSPAKLCIITHKLGSPLHIMFVCLTGTETALPSCQPRELVVEKQMEQFTLKVYVDRYNVEQVMELLNEARGCKRAHSSTASWDQTVSRDAVSKDVSKGGHTHNKAVHTTMEPTKAQKSIPLAGPMARGRTPGNVDPILSMLAAFFDGDDMDIELWRQKQKNSTKSKGWLGPKLALVMDVVCHMTHIPHHYGAGKRITKTKIGEYLGHKGDWVSQCITAADLLQLYGESGDQECEEAMD
ncbi:hypothetical protein K439DRAFT_1619848 [Ramaria rubella]|nr:hypothetical protein K439DRAFT_1619848 [Ramaria rubella]